MHFLVILLLVSTQLSAIAKTDLEKEIEAREKIQAEAQERRQKILEKYQKEQEALKRDLIKQGKKDSYDGQQDVNTQEDSEKPQEKRGWFFSKKRSDQSEENDQSKTEDKKGKPKKRSEIEELRAELKANEERAVNFIFQSEGMEEDLETAEKFFSKSEKEQLLALWRATLARNRTIQFVIRSLSTDPNDLEKNNAVMQVLSRALFVPFYAVAAVADNALVQGGSAVGARVIGDVVDANKGARDKTNQVTRTDMIVLFMLVDEVAQRLRNAYYDYKEAKIEKELFDYELKLAHMDHEKALDEKQESSIFFTNMVTRDIERNLRRNKLEFKNANRKLIELAGQDAVGDVELLIDLEIDESLGEILGV